MEKPSQNLVDIATLIGLFFLEKNEYNYEKTATEIQTMGICDVSENSDGSILIKTSRPGLLIGRKGTTIEGLSKFIKRKIDIEEVKWSWNDLITPVKFRLDGNWDGDGVVKCKFNDDYVMILTKPCKEYIVGQEILVSPKELLPSKLQQDNVL